MFGGSKPPPDNAFERSRAITEANIAREKEELEANKRQDADFRRRGLRGVRQLFSGAGGLAGFPKGQDTLGG